MRAIETNYAGCRFRSRLEARWAAFFDRIGWDWEYEPIDGDAYIPDFAITGAKNFLVEVKPAFTLEEFMAPVGKIERGLEDVWKSDILIVGSTPLPNLGYPHLPSVGIEPESAGLLAQHMGYWSDSDLNGPWSWEPGLWHVCGKCGAVAVHHSVQSFYGLPCSHYDGDGYLGSPDLDEIRTAWRRAGTDVRWSPPKGTEVAE